MSVKEYFDSNANPQEQGYVFVLLPGKAKSVYEDYVKRAADSLSFRCESFIDQKTPGIIIEDILGRMQKAEILIYDISDFNPNVMWELGVGLTIKEADKVILLKEKSEADIPFNIYQHRVSFEYDLNDSANMEQLRESLSEVMRRINRASVRDNPVKSHEVRKLIESATRSIENKDWITAQVLFEKMDTLEPENWYIYNQWGIMLRAKNDFQSAVTKFNQAIEFARFEDEKSFIYTELGILYQKNRRYNEAEDWFKKAEKADNKNKYLYLAWAEFHDELADYFNAQTRINSVLGKLKESDPDFKEFKLRHDYYNHKIGDSSYKRSFEEFKREQRRLQQPPRPEEFRRDYRRDTVSSRPPQGRSFEPKPIPENNIPYDISWEEFKRNFIGTVVDGIVNGIDEKFGLFVTLTRNLSGLIYWRYLPQGFEQRFSINQPIKVKIQSATIDTANGKKRISLVLAE
jgi:tetratricopeptide (TPR) repeat protein